MKRHLLTLIAATAMLFTCQSAQAQIQAGDVLAVDFGSTLTTGDPSGTWNNVTTATFVDETDLISNLARLSDGNGTGVGLQWDGLAGFSTGGIDTTSTVPAPVNAQFEFSGIGRVPNSAQGDLSFFSGPSRLVLTGLNTDLTYDLEIFSRVTNDQANARNPRDVVANGDEIQPNYDPNTQPFQVTAQGLEANDNGTINILFPSGTGPINQQHVNAFALTAIAGPAAVPEPSSAFVLLGLGGLSALRRRRR